MARTPTEIKSLARAHTATAIRVLAGIMEQEAASEMARIAAANSLLDRGWGKATQLHAGDEDGSPIKFEKIERIIVNSPDSNSGSVPKPAEPEPV